MKPLPKYTDW
jgi:pyruvate/2-oxoglutarate/acetoin dehydrogenase E1 component